MLAMLVYRWICWGNTTVIPNQCPARNWRERVTEMRVTLFGPLTVTAAPFPAHAPPPALPTERASPIDSCVKNWTIAPLTFALEISLQGSLSLLNFNSDVPTTCSLSSSLSLCLPLFLHLVHPSPLSLAFIMLILYSHCSNARAYHFITSSRI